MKKSRHLRKDKKIALCILIALLIFLLLWILFYPWDSKENKSISETKKETEENAVMPEDILAEMTLEEKIYQMFIVSPEQITGVNTVTAAGETTKLALQTYPVGGIMYSKPNMISQEQIKEVIDNSQSYSDINLFIAVDEEGGTVNRLMDTLGTTRIDSMYTYKNKGTKTARENARTIAKDMKSLGFNLDFAPVADVWTNPQNTVIGERAYSDDFKEAAELVNAAVEGFHEGGVLCTLKHFPGHGDTAEDTHTSTAYVTKSIENMKGEEFLPFEAGMDAGAELVMVGHMIVESVDDSVPASLSEKIVTKILREELGFDGLIITDALNMAAISEQYPSGQAAVMAVKAGNDLLLEPENLTESVNGIMEAVTEGDISEERINESVLRILQTKYDAGILE